MNRAKVIKITLEQCQIPFVKYEKRMNVPGSRDEGTQTMVTLVLVSMFSSVYVLSFVLVLSGSIFLSCPFFFFLFCVLSYCSLINQ